MPASLLLAFPAFVIAVFGVMLAILAFSFGWICAFVLAIAVALAGWLVDLAARTCLLWRQPVAAVWFMEAWPLFPGAFAAIASALLIIANVELKPGESAGLSAEHKEILSAVLAALTALLTATFLKAADDADENWVAPHIRDAFYARYQARKVGAVELRNVYYFNLGNSEVERWVYRDSYGGAKGWGFASRNKRARGIKQALRNNDQPDPNRT